MILETKKFYLTSEFWATVSVNVGAMLSAAEGVIPAKWVPLIGAASIGAYAVSRGLSKSGVAPGGQPQAVATVNMDTPNTPVTVTDKRR